MPKKVLENIAVFMRVEDLKIPVSGSTKDKCSECGKEIWVGPNVLLHPKAKSAKKVCVQCTPNLLGGTYHGKIEGVELV